MFTQNLKSERKRALFLFFGMPLNRIECPRILLNAIESLCETVYELMLLSKNQSLFNFTLLHFYTIFAYR